ncbi:MAG: nitrile hydratase accessory protein [Gammaproteobacteria bacterium]
MEAGDRCPVMPNVTAVPGIPRDEDGVVFAAPWEAKAFALVVHLHQRGCFAWGDWVDALSGEIAADRTRAEPTPYYLLWLAAAERLFAARGLVDTGALAQARAALQVAQAGAHDHAADHDHAH